MPAVSKASDALGGNAFASDDGDGLSTSVSPTARPQTGEQPGGVDSQRGAHVLHASDPLQLTNQSRSVAGGPCEPPPSCDAPLPHVGPAKGFRFPWSAITARGQARHRGRDLILVSGEPQWVLGKFAYGAIDKDVHREDVEVYILRNCGSKWTKVGTFRTTGDDEHDAVEGVQDTGGRVFVNLAHVGIASGTSVLDTHALIWALTGFVRERTRTGRLVQKRSRILTTARSSVSAH